MKIFSGNSNKDFAINVAKHLNIELSPLEIFVFPDKEKRIRIEEKVVDEDCVVVQSTGEIADINYMELFLIINALKRSGAKSIRALIPYFGYQRQDHIFRDGEGVSLEVIAKTLGALGVSQVITFDLHTPKIPELFNIPVKHLSAIPEFVKRIKRDFKDEEIVLVSPDMGGIRRIKEVSELLGNSNIASVVKDRDLATGNIKDSGLEGEVSGKISVIVDDMISTGNTIADASSLLLKNGSTKVFAFATHGVFSKEAKEILQNSSLEKVYVTDTLKIPNDREFEKLEIISVADIAANSLKETL
jgi:ribose-phosphate pyrophosphokinase